jgi:hypothetical protein
MPGEDDRNRDYFGERPPPTVDPTKVTTEAIDRLEKSLKELLKTQRDADHRWIEDQLAHTNEQVEINTVTGQNLRVEIASQQERFTSIKGEFALRDANLDKALTAAKELVSVQQTSNDRANTKMEAGFEKRIEGTADVISKTSENLSDKITAAMDRIGSLETRIVTIESNRSGIHDQRVSSNMTQTMMIAIGVLVLLAAEFLLHFIK